MGVLGPYGSSPGGRGLSEQVKMSYNATLTRVKCELTRAACQRSEAPPADLITRAKAKLEAVKAAGDIAFYFLYETRLAEAWTALRAEQELPEDAKIVITLGAGAPALPGIRVEKTTQEKAIASLSIDTKADAMKTWRFEWFKLFVTKRIRELGIKEHPNNAQIYAAFVKAQSGDRIQGHAIGATAATLGGPGAKAFSVLANKQRREIGVVIRNVKEIRAKANRDAMLALIMQAVRQLSDGGVEYRILKKDFLSSLQAALEGPECLGLDLPLVLLAAVGQPAKGKTTQVFSTNYPGAGRISFDVSNDKMEASITGFAVEFYDDPTFQVNTDWVQNELKRCGIFGAIPDDVMKGLGDAIAKHEDLNGKLANRGVVGVGGKAPVLHPSYKDAASRMGGTNVDIDDLDMREMQQRATVKTGQLVAEIRYGTPPVAGRNVYGEEMPPPASDELIVRVGEGIQQREAGRFYASCDGIPQLETEAVSLSKILVHEGDVNLRTGNIRFDGPVEIKGSIDHGAVVETSGDLIVHGTIRGADVRAAGSITVKAGITTGATGRVHARGDLAADFIENSNITCGGNLIVAKALLNSQVISGGTVKVVSKGGVIAGGKIITKDSLATGNLGFKRGAVTVLDIGVDWRTARALHIREGRFEKLQKRQQDDRQALRELVQKTKAQMTQRHKELKEELQDRLARMRNLIEKCEQSVARCRSQLTYSSTARIYVQELLVANVNVTLCGQGIAVVNEVINVAILPKRRRGSYIVPLEEVQAEEKGDGSASKKAG